MSRRYVSDRYDERDRDYHRDSRGDRVYDDYKVGFERERYERRPARAETVLSEARRPPRREPDFLREDYNHTTAGPLVVRDEELKEYAREKGKSDVSVVGSQRGGRPPAEKIVKEELIVKDRIREDRPENGRRSTVSRAPREENDRRSEVRDRPPPDRTRYQEEEEIIIRKKERDYSPPPRRKELVDGSEVGSRRGGSRPPPIRREVDREEILIREGRSPHRDREVIDKQEIVVRERDSPPARYERDYGYDEVVYRERERAPHPRMRSLGAPIAREREEFVFRRRRSPSPSPPPPEREYEREQIIIRRRDSSPPPRAPSPESSPSPEPEPPREPTPELPPFVRQPIIQHVYTHHHHIDHGLERARSPTPPPPPPPIPEPPPALPPPKAKGESLEIEIRRRGTRSGKEVQEREIVVEREVETKDRVKEDLQITRRRSVSSRPPRRDGGDRRDSGRLLRRDMWTEVTKDLVIKEAIEKMGYQYEESTHYFYVVEYLQYEDVRRLVELSEEIRRKRRDRMRDLNWEADHTDRTSLLKGRAGKVEERERIYEHEHIERRNTRF